MDHLLPSTLASLSFLSPLLLLISSACPPTFICSSSSSVPSSSQSSSPAPAPSNCCLSGRDSSLFRVTDSCPRVGKSVRGVLSSVSCDGTPLLGLSECKRRRCHRAKESKGERQWRFSHYLIKLTKGFAYFEYFCYHSGLKEYLVYWNRYMKLYVSHDNFIFCNEILAFSLQFFKSQQEHRLDGASF